MDAFKLNDLIDEDLIFMDMEAKDSDSLLRRLSEAAQEKGYVRKGYADAVLEREQQYPTALPTEILRVAIPHATDRDQVIRSVIVVAMLKEPVLFKEMGDGVREIPVDAVFMLAVCGSKEQLTVLQKIVGMFSDREVMTAVKNVGNKAELIGVLKENLAG
ncbi:MAG: PTS sugar transporter subunit IIA [Bacillota bacterium]